MTLPVETDYFEPGPVDEGGIYSTRRSSFDGFLGILDGVASTVNSIGHTVEEVADGRVAWARGQAAHDDVALTRDERELNMLLDRTKVDRGDNVQLYYAAGAVALAAILLLR